MLITRGYFDFHDNLEQYAAQIKAKEFLDESGRFYKKLFNIWPTYFEENEKIKLGDKEYSPQEFLNYAKELYKKPNKTKEEQKELFDAIKTISERISIFYDTDNPDHKELDKEQEQLEKEIVDNFLRDISKEIKEAVEYAKNELFKKEKKWTSELPGYLITGGVGGVSGVAGAFLRKKLPTWAAISIIPATVIPTAFLTEYTLPEGYKPQKISDMFKKEYLKERGGHLVGKTLVGLLSGLATYGLTRKFTK